MFNIARDATIYGSARIAEARALTESELRIAAPSVFAVDAHESRSLKFKPIPTFEVIEALAKEGFSVVKAAQSRTRDASKRDFTKHLLRLRRLDEADKYVRNGVAFEVLLKNANDGTSAYDLMAGFWRFVCGNGLVVGETLADVKVRHSGDVEKKVVEGTYSVLDNAQLLLEAPDKWASVDLKPAEQVAFARAAHELRFDAPEDGRPVAVQPPKLLTIHRDEDAAPSLWNTFNVVQENAIKGGLSGFTRNPETGRTRRVETREIKGIDQNVKLNRALWVLAEEMAKLKLAA